MYEKLEECPVCSFPSHENYLICDDHSVSHESFALVKCPKCHLIYTNPRPSQDTIGNYYQSDNYISHTSKANNLINHAYKFARSFTLRWKHNIIRSYHTTPGTILDYGAGTGDFLHYMQRKKWDTYGVEPNEQALAISQGKGIEVHTQLTKKNKIQYDIITAWHVLEHVHELKDTIRKLRKRLNDNGHMLVALPNHQSFDAQHYQTVWAGYDVPRHLYHFSPDSFKYLLTQTKLKLKEVIPMPLDAYYVSILSEKYNGTANPITAGLKLGYQSNKHAAKNDKQYSSLIYVLTK